MRIFNLLLIIIVLIAFGCSNLSDSDEKASDSVLPFEGKLYIAIDSTYIYGGSDDSTTYIRLQTEEIYSCMNNSIIYTIQKRGGQFKVTLEDVKILGVVCLTALGPAISRIPVNLSPGDYRMIIGNSLIWDIYDLKVTEYKMSLITMDTSFSVYVDSL